MTTRKKYSQEFKLDAVSLVLEQGYSRAAASRNLDVNPTAFVLILLIYLFLNYFKKRTLQLTNLAQVQWAPYRSEKTG